MKVKGFTLIEVMIVIAIIGIILSMAMVFYEQQGKAKSDYVCKAGFKFTHDGKQIIGQNGGGVPCEQAINNYGGVR